MLLRWQQDFPRGDLSRLDEGHLRLRAHPFPAFHPLGRQSQLAARFLLVWLCTRADLALAL